jgi:hypothetical protein
MRWHFQLSHLSEVPLTWLSAGLVVSKILLPGPTYVRCRAISSSFSISAFAIWRGAIGNPKISILLDLNASTNRLGEIRDFHADEGGM